MWWVLRLNAGFPEHDLHTLFIDGHPIADLTGDATSDVPLVASVPALSTAAAPTLDAQIAERVLSAVAHFVDYGSEHGDPCPFCSECPD